MLFDLGDHPALVLPTLRLILEVLEEPLDLGQRRPPHRARQPVRDLLAQDVVGRQPDGVKVACVFQAFVDRGDRIGGIRPEEAGPTVAASISGDDGVEDVPPVVGAVDVAMPQGTSFLHAELVEKEVRVLAVAVEVPFPSGPFLVVMGGADQAVHVQHDGLQPVKVMEAVDSLPVQVGQRCPVLGQSQRLGLEPPHQRGRGRLRIDSPTTDNLAHDRIEGQPLIDRLPE